MILKSEIEKVATKVFPVFESSLTRKIWINGFEFSEWLQNNWFYTGYGWVKSMLPELDQKEKSIEELFEMFLKESDPIK